MTKRKTNSTRQERSDKRIKLQPAITPETHELLLHLSNTCNKSKTVLGAIVLEKALCSNDLLRKVYLEALNLTKQKASPQGKWRITPRIRKNYFQVFGEFYQECKYRHLEKQTDMSLELMMCHVAALLMEKALVTEEIVLGVQDYCGVTPYNRVTIVKDYNTNEVHYSRVSILNEKGEFEFNIHFR
jgi:hypothetical protein